MHNLHIKKFLIALYSLHIYWPLLKNNFLIKDHQLTIPLKQLAVTIQKLTNDHIGICWWGMGAISIMLGDI